MIPTQAHAAPAQCVRELYKRSSKTHTHRRKLRAPQSLAPRKASLSRGPHRSPHGRCLSAPALTAASARTARDSAPGAHCRNFGRKRWQSFIVNI